MAKTASKKSKSVVVVYFASADNFEMPTKRDYAEMETKLGSMRVPEDIKTLPSVIIGNKLLKLDARVEVVVEGETWKFSPTRSAKSRPDIENDSFVKLAAEQLTEWAAGKRKYILVPYYAKFEKTK